MAEEDTKDVKELVCSSCKKSLPSTHYSGKQIKLKGKCLSIGISLHSVIAFANQANASAKIALLSRQLLLRAPHLLLLPTPKKLTS